MAQLPLFPATDPAANLMQTKWKSLLDPLLKFFGILSVGNSGDVLTSDGKGSSSFQPLPVTVAAGVVAVSYGLTTAQTVGAAGTLKFDTLVYDPSSLYNTSTGMFTAPQDGLYSCTTAVISTSNSNMLVSRNGVQLAYISTASSATANTGTLLVYLATSDTVSFDTQVGTTFNGGASPFSCSMSINLIN